MVNVDVYTKTKFNGKHYEKCKKSSKNQKNTKTE